MCRLSRSELWLLFASVGLGLWLTLAMPVFAQESYYWCYGEHPDLSYFDHPPMVGWLIWLGTALFGDGALGIRLGTWISGTVTVLAGLELLRAFDAPRWARIAWLTLSLIVPSMVICRFFSNPDPPLCCFWMLTLVALWKARSGSLGWWALAGLMAGSALLSKYTAVFLAVGGVVVLIADPSMRRQLRRPGPYLGVATAVVTFMPVIWWNVTNNFESFRYQTSDRWRHAEFGLRGLGELTSGQLLVLNPVVAAALPVTVWWLWRRSRAKDPRTLWLLAFGLPMVGFLLALSVVIQVKLNWLIPGLLPLLVGVALWWGESGFSHRHAVAARRLVRAAAILAIPLALAPLVVLVPQHSGSSWSGWDEIASRAEHWKEVVDNPDKKQGNVFFFAGDYRDAAQLTRHLKLLAEGAESGKSVEPAMAENVFGECAKELDHWEQPGKRVGQDAIFVLPRPDSRAGTLETATRYFESIKRVERVRVKRLGIQVLAADVFVCRGYRGPRLCP